MINTMKSGFPRLAKFVVIFLIKNIRNFFNFQCFPNDMRGVIGSTRVHNQNFSLVKENEIIRFLGILDDN
jgi:hypothetical protein